eukprot:TRINITY_DN45225_c0_g1_i1.p1 TRINITY_DN45225_c0_g1~~TRINITY_DN45225_c0_g1_i1.p1  ORF type:complete len:392 (-),score=66.47 TRINITY_DN45225_c0_g1_i1:92-1267(-)
MGNTSEKQRRQEKLSRALLDEDLVEVYDDGDFRIRAGTPSRRKPILCLANPKSGGQAGKTLISRLCDNLSVHQVFDIGKIAPYDCLRKFVDWETKEFSQQGLRVLVCGGDGTVRWILEELDRLHSEGVTDLPPVGVLPLGTGNDLARTLGWGGGFNENGDLTEVLYQVYRAGVCPLDRWRVVVRAIDEDGNEAPESEAKVILMNNYLSFGVDAEVCWNFHDLRERNPEKFSSRHGNKVIYAQLGASKVLASSPFKRDLLLQVSGKPTRVDPTSEALIITNLPNYSGGNDFWGTQNLEREGFQPQQIDDGMLEVVTVDNMLHMARLQTDLFHARRVAQSASICVELRRPMYMQVDGEPWLQQPATIRISHWKKSAVLKFRPKLRKPGLGMCG